MNHSTNGSSLSKQLLDTAYGRLQQIQRRPELCTLHPQRLSQCALLCYCVKNLKLEIWTLKKGRFFVCSHKHKVAWAPAREDCFKVVVSSLWRTILLTQKTKTPRTLHPELSIMCSIQTKHRCNPFKPDVPQSHSFHNQHARTVLFRIVLD